MIISDQDKAIITEIIKKYVTEETRHGGVIPSLYGIIRNVIASVYKDMTPADLNAYTNNLFLIGNISSENRDINHTNTQIQQKI